jgi:hypothetical protein
LKKAFPIITTIEDPVNANVKGYFNIGRMMYGEENS